MIYYRPHRGSLEESMEHLKTFDTLTDLVNQFRQELSRFGFKFSNDQVSIRPYMNEPDLRIGWPDTWIVTIEGYGPIGFITHKPNHLLNSI